MSAFAKAQGALDRFFLTPGSPRPLAALRIALAGVLLLQAWMLRTNALDFLAHDGLVQGDLARFLAAPFAPHMAGIVATGGAMGLSEAATIYGICGVYVLALVAMLVGWRTRAATTVVWLIHWTLTASAQTVVYGIDTYARVFLFYLMLSPCGDALSVDVWRGRRSEHRSVAARLGLRAMQLHLCLTYFISGVEKARGPQWWDGELLWRALSMPIYHHFDMAWLANWIGLSRIAGWTTLVAETFYVVCIWPRATRRLWVPLMISLHAGIAVMLGLNLFGLVMALLTLVLFGLADWDATPGSWLRLFKKENPPELLGSLPGGS